MSTQRPAPTAIGEDDILMISGTREDIAQIAAANDNKSPIKFPVLAQEYMVGHPELTFFDWSKNAVTHIARVKGWKQLHKLAYEIECDGFTDLAEPVQAHKGLDALINEVCSGNACHISTIYGAELRVYPYALLEITDEYTKRLDFNEQLKQLVKPQRDAFRAHPDWADSLRYLAKHPSFSGFYYGCAESLVEVGIEKGYITPTDIENARRARGMNEQGSGI